MFSSFSLRGCPSFSPIGILTAGSNPDLTLFRGNHMTTVSEIFETTAAAVNCVTYEIPAADINFVVSSLFAHVRNGIQTEKLSPKIKKFSVKPLTSY